MIVELGLLTIVVLGAIGVLLIYRQERAARKFLAHDAAFTEQIRAHPFDQEQLDRLRDRVSSVGALALNPPSGPNGAPVNPVIHVFVVDVNGAVHDVVRTVNARHASVTAHGLSDAWGLPIDDHRGVLEPPDSTSLLSTDQTVGRPALADAGNDVDADGRGD